ncbi:invertebrate-type lysozyme 3-like [Pollicipes pollicipes]|uniref:invertebrate-type lysozyme 3-like n=1 Tax=Pollicipes pollicipes TaxID=41117 RepID=UPI0018856FF0|nr:invertebrate-type lysozyme 3-like [Pollicipes pollicipes]
MLQNGAVRALAVLAAGLVVVSGADGQEARLRADRYCLSCLCTAATGCDVKAACQQNDPLDICGPFYMSEPYWVDANVTALDAYAAYEFKECATDTECAGAAVASYMHNFARDCDGDGQVTCKDFGLMHYLGYSSCADEDLVQSGLSSPFYSAHVTCLERMAGLLAREDFTTAPGYAPLV